MSLDVFAEMNVSKSSLLDALQQAFCACRCFKEVGKKGKYEKWNMKTPVYYGERQKSSPFCPTLLPTLAVSSLLEKAALRRRMCPQVPCGFLPTLLNLKPVEFCDTPFSRCTSTKRHDRLNLANPRRWFGGRADSKIGTLCSALLMQVCKKRISRK